MSIDQKVRYGLMAVTAASFLLASVGLHPGVLDPIGGAGP
jgi:hypothetical protein